MYDTNANLRWGYTYSYTPVGGYGFRKDRGYIFIGGDFHYEDYYGKLKDIKFYYNDLISQSVIKNNMFNFN